MHLLRQERYHVGFDDQLSIEPTDQTINNLLISFLRYLIR